MAYPRSGDIAREIGERGLRRQPDELGARDRQRGGRPPRRRRPERLAGGPPRWSRPGPARAARSHRPIARTPGRPSSPPSRIAAATARASLERRPGRELDVEGDQRRASADQHRSGRRMQRSSGRSQAQAHRRRCAGSARPVRRGAAAPACVRRPGCRTGRPEAPAPRRAGRRGRAPPRRRRHGRPLSDRRSAPHRSPRRAGGRPRGCRSDPPHRLGGAADDGARQLSRRAGERVGAAVVVGIGVDVEQGVAERAAIASIVAWSRPSETLGYARRVAMRADHRFGPDTARARRQVPPGAGFGQPRPASRRASVPRLHHP